LTNSQLIKSGELPHVNNRQSAIQLVGDKCQFVIISQGDFMVSGAGHDMGRHLQRNRIDDRDASGVVLRVIVSNPQVSSVML
jgi:hypothetical protein